MTRSLGSAITIAAVGFGLAMMASRPQAVQSDAVTFIATLSPANEVPAVTNGERTGSGEVTVVLNLTRDANRTITGATADFTGSVKGFPGGSTITAAHIHRGAAGANGPVAVNPGFAAGELALRDGAASFSKKGVTVTPAVAQEIIASPSAFYFNVHSQMNASGVARGQLGVPTPPAR
jgi:CHRD domain